MSSLPAQLPAGPGPHLVLYDGVCGLCNALLQFLLRHDRRRVFAFAPLQSAAARAMLERHGRNPGDLNSFYVVENYRGLEARILNSSRAAIFVAQELGWPWKMAAALRVLPVPLLNVIYDLIARNRYRIFGRYDQCVLPQPEHRRRFIE